MNFNPAKPSRINNDSRCTHRSAAGSRCRTLSSSGSLCAVHAKADAVRREADDLAATLTSGLDEFTSAMPINQFLSRLLLLLAQDRISPRRGAVMAYTANLLLRSVSVMDQQTIAAGNPKNRPVQIIWDLPRPRAGRHGTIGRTMNASMAAKRGRQGTPPGGPAFRRRKPSGCPILALCARVGFLTCFHDRGRLPSFGRLLESGRAR